jgi:hypothetical protein
MHKHTENELDPKSEKKQKLGVCFWMKADHGRGETPLDYALNLNLRNYLTIHLNRKERD